MEVGSSSSSRIGNSHDVFISFKPEDSDSFVRFLYEELYGLGMMAFEYDAKVMDEEDDGQDPTETLVKAIEESRSSIVVLSQNYASSLWCLTELTKILHRNNNNNHPVIPVFYEVDPLDVQRFSGSFKKSFEVHEHEIAQDLQLEQFSMQVQIWKNSIQKIGAMSGFVVSKHRDELDVIKIIAKEMFDRLGRNFVVPNKYESLLEMWPQLNKMEKLLDLESKEIRFIGIMGMGGMGKTTLAKVVYDRLSTEFLSNRCFLHIDNNQSLMALQRQLLSEFLLEKEIKLESEDDGIEMIKNHLGKRKVLIVLDGVNKKKQLEKLVGSPDWFGAKSRVIITTRNSDIFHGQHSYKGKMVGYQVRLLSNDGALELFCKHAFQDGNGPPEEKFEQLTEEIVEKVKGHPLALKTIGTYLYGKSKDIWKKALKNVENLVNENLYNEILKSSYEELDAESKEILLDLVCFFNGERVKVVKKILEALYGGSTVDIKIQLLVDRYLVEIVDHKIHINFLILCMGRKIIRGMMFSTQQCNKTRIWDRDDVVQVFQEKTGLNNIHGIGFLDEEEEELELDSKSFSYMTELKILKISNVKLSGHQIEFLSNQLRVLKWPEFPLQRFPSNFQPRFMVQLILPGSKLGKLWEGKQHFERLKEIDVSDSKNLVETPDFSSAPNLERLILRNCSRLSNIHPSISNLGRLVFLDMSGCANVKKISSDIICCISPPQISNSSKFSGVHDKMLVEYPNLNPKTLYIFPPIYISKSMSDLTYLNLKNCAQLSTLPTAIGSLTSLITLNLNGCKNLVKIPPSLWTLNSLVELDIGGTSVKQLMKKEAVPGEPPVVVSNLEKDHTDELIPPVVFSLKNLKTLNFENLYRSIWSSFAALLTSNCRLLCIRDLNLSNCNLLDEDIPQDLRPINTLEILDLSGNHFVRLSESLSQLINLKALYLNHCSNLKQLPSGLPTSLRYVSGIKSLPLLPNSEGSSTSLSSPLPSNNPLVEEADHDNLSQPVVEEEYMYRCREADTNINKMEQLKFSNLVGMEDQLEKVYDLLDLERRNNEVIFLGIFGMSGIGKTSLARVVYKTIAHKFESSCFLHISKQSNLPSLQHQLLSQLLLSKAPIKVGDKNNYGEELIKKYVSCRKVVIVLDGVDEMDQIEKLNGLARSPDWFSPGSRVIITSSNRKVLRLPTYEDKVLEYNVALLDEASAFQLFCKHAFRNDHPPDQDFKDLSSKIIRKLERLPLALRGIGSFLYNKDIDEWKETLMKLSKVEEDFLGTIWSKRM